MLRLSLLTLILPLIAFGQQKKQSAFTIDYNYQIPNGILSKTYGNSSELLISYFIEKPNNLFFGVETGYMFGDNINDTTILQNIETENGSIIGSDGYYGNINLYERGFNAYVFMGYAIHPHKSRKLFFPYLHNLAHKELSGFYISIGLGYLRHKIFIDTQNQNLPQLDVEYKEGYDKLRGGISTKLSADYKFYSKKRNLQFSIGCNYVSAYTKNLRPYSFKEMNYSSSCKRWDQILGFKFGIIIPIHRMNTEEFHYY